MRWSNAIPAWLQFLTEHQLAQPAVTLCVGILAAAFAFITVSTNRWTARMRATLDLLERLETHEHFQKRYRAFRQIRMEADGILRIIEVYTGSDTTERDLCLDFFNAYEFIALAINRGILDEGFFREAYQATLIRDWYAAAPLILHMRKTDPKNFEYIEWLVARCERKWYQIRGPKTLSQRRFVVPTKARKPEGPS